MSYISTVITKTWSKDFMIHISAETSTQNLIDGLPVPSFSRCFFKPACTGPYGRCRLKKNIEHFYIPYFLRWFPRKLAWRLIDPIFSVWIATFFKRQIIRIHSGAAGFDENLIEGLYVPYFHDDIHAKLEWRLLCPIFFTVISQATIHGSIMALLFSTKKLDWQLRSFYVHTSHGYFDENLIDGLCVPDFQWWCPRYPKAFCTCPQWRCWIWQKKMIERVYVQYLWRWFACKIWLKAHVFQVFRGDYHSNRIIHIA